MCEKTENTETPATGSEPAHLDVRRMLEIKANPTIGDDTTGNVSSPDSESMDDEPKAQNQSVVCCQFERSGWSW